MQLAAENQAGVDAVSTTARLSLRRGRIWALMSGDLLALASAYAFSFVVAEEIGPLPAVSAPGWFLAGLALAAAFAWIAVFTAYRLYENDASRISVSSVDEVGALFHAMLAGSLAFLILSQGLRYLAGWWVYSAVEAALFLGAALVTVPLARYSIRGWIFPRVMQRRRAMIIGDGPDAVRVQQKLSAHPEYGLDVVAQVKDADDGLAELIDALEIDRVVLASTDEHTLDVVRMMRRPELQVSVVPRYSEIFTSNARLDEVEGMPLVSLPPMRLGRSSRVLKRSFDIVAAGGALLVLSPLLGLIALAIRIETPGPAIFRQPRRGRNGGTFRIAKFRTMVDGAEASRQAMAHLNEVDGPLFKLKGQDPRVTRLGAFLRRTSLDELPQLWNVLRGEMSLVGPRPFVIYEADQIVGWASRRLDMTPGITGLWQVLGRNDMPFAEMVKLDYVYVTNWSLWWDVKILCQTIPVVLARRGAY